MTRQSLPEIGQRFGRWTVIGSPVWTETSPRRAAVPCRCDCNTERVVLVASLRRGDRSNPSCGCWRRERTATIVSETRWKDSHGRAAGAKDPLYRLWLRIKRRCYDPAAHNYKWYGAKGVTMHEGWINDPAAFITYIEQNLGSRPSPQHSIDRIDPYGNYEPGNIRWATPLEQARNRR